MNISAKNSKVVTNKLIKEVEITFPLFFSLVKNLKKAVVLVDIIKVQGAESHFSNGFSGICEYRKENGRPVNLIVTLGAGDIWKVADEYIQWLGRNN